MDQLLTDKNPTPFYFFFNRKGLCTFGFSQEEKEHGGQLGILSEVHGDHAADLTACLALTRTFPGGQAGV